MYYKINSGHTERTVSVNLTHALSIVACYDGNVIKENGYYEIWANMRDDYNIRILQSKEWNIVSEEFDDIMRYMTIDAPEAKVFYGKKWQV